MYINAPCPFCSCQIKKIGISVIKPGFINCPECGRISWVTGLGSGLLAYVVSLLLFCILLSPLKNTLNDSWIILPVIGILFLCTTYLMSLFLGLKKG